MARLSKKSIYEKIKDQEQKIKESEKITEKLRGELQILFDERDDLEMKALLKKVRESNLDINKALEMLTK